MFSIEGKRYFIDGLIVSANVSNGLSYFEIKAVSDNPFMNIQVRGNTFNDSNFIRKYSDSILVNPTAYVFFGFVSNMINDSNIGTNISGNQGQFYFSIDEKNNNYVSGTFKGRLGYTGANPPVYKGSIQVTDGQYKLPFHY